MTIMQRLESILSRFPAVAVATYLAAIFLFVFLTADGIVQALQRRDAVAASAEILERLGTKGRTHPSASRPDVSVPSGSPFLEGASSSVAGAALLHRVTAATKRLNGSTLSSQVDLQGSRSKAGFISATFSVEIDPVSLQPLLYDLEAGMPFLFIDELVVQAPSSATDAARLRVLLGVSAQRQGAK